MANTQNKQFSKQLYAHRGVVGPYPENTLEAFRKALADGATALETDVHLTGDKEIVVFHDDDGARVANTGQQIKKATLADIKKWKLGNSSCQVPTLSEALQAFPNIFFNIDIKSVGLESVTQTIKIIRQNNAEKRCRLGSFSPHNMGLIHSYKYKGPLAANRTNLLKLFFLPKSFLLHIKYQCDAAMVPLSYWFIPFGNSYFINKCHELGIRVDYWIINNPEKAAELFSKGADGIVTDNPASMLQAFSKLEHNSQ